MTTKVWAATDREIAACIADPSHIDALFHRVADEDHALIHGWRGGGLPSSARKIEGASDDTYAVRAVDVVAALRDPAWEGIFAIATEAANHVEIIDIARAAAATGAGLLFCTFEDW